MRPHYEVRFADGLTPFDALDLEGVTESLKRTPDAFEDRLMTVRGVNTRVYLEDIFNG